jgi:hypothetical protein
MANVANRPFRLNVIMLSVVMLNVVDPIYDSGKQAKSSAVTKEKIEIFALVLKKPVACTINM